MTQFKTIVLTTDLSKNADVAAAYAVELASKDGATIHLVYVFEPTLYTVVAPDAGVYYDADWLAQLEKESEVNLKVRAANLQVPANVQVVPHFLKGNPAAEIVKFAKAVNADCIAMATHGRTGFSHFLFGSVAEKVVRTSPCIVLTIKPEPIGAADAPTHEKDVKVSN